MLRKEVLRLTNAMKFDAPLMRAGSMLTGRIAAVVHMLCNPGKAPMIPYPGQDPVSLIRANFTPFTSIPLHNGRSYVITTPKGRYNVFRTIDPEVALNAVEIDPTGQSLYKDPVMVLATTSLGGYESCTTVFGQGSTGTRSLWITGKTGTNFNLEVDTDAGGSPQSLILDVPDALFGTDLIVSVNGVQNVFAPMDSARYCLGAGPRVSGGNCPADIDAQHYLQVAAATATIDNVMFGAPAQSNLPVLIKVPFSRFSDDPAHYKNYNIPIDLQNYFGYRTPQVSQLSNGGMNAKGGFIAASTIITSDASAIANGGYVFGATINDVPLIPPAYLTFSEWVSGRTNWYFKGQLKRGMYQIYVPDEISLEADNDTTSSPWFSEGREYYSMVFIIDNSFTVNGAAPPAATQCHVIWESVYSTSGAGSIIPAASTLNDIGWPLALSILRGSYQPTANDAHIDAMKDWLHGTLNSLVNYGKDIIHSPVTKEIVSNMISKGVPLAIEAVSSLL